MTNPNLNSFTKPDEHLAELLISWEESRHSGKPLTAASLCQDCPELIPDLEREIQILCSMDGFLYPEVSRAATHSTFPPLIFESPQLDGFTIESLIGEGGMGVVYKVRQLSLDRTVAIKTLFESRRSNPRYVDRLKREAKALSKLNHDHIVQVHDVIEIAGTVAIVLEYVDGTTLGEMLKGTPLPALQAAAYAHTVSDTLSVVHQHGLLHRDIKPSNLLINRQGKLKIADFGLAKQQHASDQLSRHGEVFGSPSYMAPEQAAGQNSQVDERTDLYAVGATLYEMVTGRAPFVGETPIATLHQAIHSEPVPPSLLNPSIPRDLETICLKCLEKQSSKRFSTATELADELERFLEGRPICSRPIGPFDRLWRWCKRRPAPAALIGVSFSAVMAIAAILGVSGTAHERNLKRYNQDLTVLNDKLQKSAADANEHKEIAEANEATARDALYASDMARVVTAWKQEDTREMTEVLARHVPKPGEFDRRGFEWQFLHRQANLTMKVLLEADSALYSLCLSPDQHVLAAAGKGAIVRILDPNTGQLRSELSTGQIEVNGMAFSPDQSELATAGDDGTIRIWNLANESERLRIQTPYKKAFTVLFVPSGERIVACGNGTAICVYDSITGENTITLKGHERSLESIVFDQQGNNLISVGNDEPARVWDLGVGQEIVTLPSSGTVEAVLVEPKREILITGNTKGLLRTVHIRERKEIAIIEHLDRVSSLALHPNGNWLAVGDATGRIRLRSLGEKGDFPDDAFQPWQAHHGSVHSLVFSNDGSRLISCGKDGRVISWNAHSTQGRGPQRFSLEQASGNWPAADRREMVVNGPPNGFLMRWNLTSARSPAQSLGSVYQESELSPDGRFFAAVFGSTGQCQLRLFAVPNDPALPIDQQLVAQIEAKGFYNLGGFSADSQSLVAVDSITKEKAAFTQLLRLPSLEIQQQFPTEQATYSAVSPDGAHLLFAKSGEVSLWDVAAKNTVWSVPQEGVRKMTISPSGRLFAAATSNRIISVRKSGDGQQLFQLSNHRYPVQAMKFSPDERTLVTAMTDGTIKFSHVPTGQELMEFPKVGMVQGLMFGANNDYLLCHLRPDPIGPHELVVFDGTIRE